MKSNLFLKILISLFLILIPHFVAFVEASEEALQPSQMWVRLKVVEDVSTFYINLPEEGCVSIMASIPGKKLGERLWGPHHMPKGAFKIAVPASKTNDREGFVEFFKLKLVAENDIGSRGNGDRQFNSPMGIDYDNLRQEILIADTGNDRIVRLARDGRYLGKHGGFGLSFGDKTEEKEDSLDNPYDVTTGGYSNFYVSDQNNKRICVFDSYRSYRGKFYPPDNRRTNALNRPKGITIDSENNIWIIDGRSDKAIKIAPNGDKLLEIGGFGRGEQQLSSPNQIAISPNGEVYIADTGKGRIAVFDRLGAYLHSLTSSLSKPFAICIDPDGLLLICDQRGNKLHVFTPKGQALHTLDEAFDGSKFKGLSDISCNDDQIYVLDSRSHRLTIIKKEKEATLVSWQGANTVVK